MSDVNVTVMDAPIQVSVTDTPLQINVSSLGGSGPPGAQGPPGTDGTGVALPFIFNRYSIPSGNASTGFIPFNYTFSTVPSVVGNLVNNSGDAILACHVSGINTSGFYLNFSEDLTTNNYSYHYQATTGTGYFALGGGVGSANSHSYSVKTVTSNYIFTSSDDVVVFNNPFRVTGTLPVAGGAGKIYMVKSVNTGEILITGNLLDTIDGELTQSINQWDSISLIDYTANKWIIV